MPQPSSAGRGSQPLWTFGSVAGPWLAAQFSSLAVGKLSGLWGLQEDAAGRRHTPSARLSTSASPPGPPSALQLPVQQGGAWPSLDTEAFPGWVGMEVADLVTDTWFGQQCDLGDPGRRCSCLSQAILILLHLFHLPWGSPLNGLLLVHWERDSPRGSPSHLSSWVFHELPRLPCCLQEVSWIACMD